MFDLTDIIGKAETLKLTKRNILKVSPFMTPLEFYRLSLYKRKQSLNYYVKKKYRVIQKKVYKMIFLQFRVLIGNDMSIDDYGMINLPF